jgi:tryptophan synthase beta subunit
VSSLQVPCPQCHTNIDVLVSLLGLTFHTTALADGQVIEPHSISAGLDYPGIGPEHSFLMDIGRAEYGSVTDDEAMQGSWHALSPAQPLLPWVAGVQSPTAVDER